MYPIAFIICIISTAVLMACDNVALVVSVNPNVRPRGGPQPSGLSPPFINNHNVINNNTSSRETNGGKDAGSEESRLNGDNRIRLVGATDRKSTSTEISNDIITKQIRTDRPIDLTALTIPLAMVAQLTMPPKTLTRIALTLSSSVMILKASFT